MIAVSDASPICYLVVIAEIEVLPRLFGQIHLPQQVLEELRAEGAPSAVRAWAGVLPSWVSVHAESMGKEEGLERLNRGNELQFS